EEREETRQREKILSREEGEGKKRTEKKPSSHRANEPIFSHLARPDGEEEEKKKKKQDAEEETAMNFALPEDGAKEERGGAREETTHGGMEEERKREKEREYDRGMRMKDSKNEETKEPTSVVAMETGPDLLASLKELGPST
ncbi:hypothetical protein ALC53_10375, partial [Atta colombica]